MITVTQNFIRFSIWELESLASTHANTISPMGFCSLQHWSNNSFLIFDLELLFMMPLAVSLYHVNNFGCVNAISFFVILL
jgi:hypothetical protein